jgi:hypothetical protein
MKALFILVLALGAAFAATSSRGVDLASRASAQSDVMAG